MNNVEELKQFAVLHARSQGLGSAAALLDRIRADDGDTPGSWVRVWSDAAARHEARGRQLDACRHYIMARFPFVDGAARGHAQQRCVDTFDQWRRARTDIEYLDLAMHDGRVRCWASGLSSTA